MSNVQVRKIVRFVVPTMLTNVCFFLFSIIDGIFVGRGVGTNGLGAVNLTMPFVMIVGALFMLVNIGGATIFAVRLGQNDTEGANKVFRNGMILLSFAAVVLCLAGTFGADVLCTLFGANETFHKLSVDYLFWYSVFIIPSGLSMGFQCYCRNDDEPGLVGIVTIITTIINIFGDWLLIFPLGMGTKGAAIATGVSQTIGLFLLLTHFIRKKGILRFGKTKLDRKLLWNIIVHGLPEGIGQLATPVMTLCMNLVLVSHIADIGVNAFSLISYVASFSVAIFFGTSEGLQPLFGQSYGEKNEGDMKYYYRVGLEINLIGSTVLTGIIILLSRAIFIMFGADEQTIEYTVDVLPKYAWGFIPMAYNVMTSSYLYSTERSVYAIILNVLRSLVVSVLVIMLLPKIFGANIIWFMFGIYEALILVVAVILLKHSERNGINFEKGRKKV